MSEDRKPWQGCYPSGYLMPEYGPSTDDEQITDALEWAHEMLLRRDEMNAAIHCTSLRLSPITQKVAVALSIHRIRVGGTFDESAVREGLGE